VATLPDYPLRVPMHKIIDIGNFVRRSLSERDGRILLLNSWTPLSSYDFCVVHTSSRSYVSMCDGWRSLSGKPTVTFMKGHFAHGVLRAFAPDVVS